MPLSQNDRIIFSKSLVTTDQKIAIYQSALAGIQAQIAEAQAKDDANQRLVAGVSNIIEAYEYELNCMTGVQRIALSTGAYSKITDSGNLVSGNYFYPNTGVAIPSCPTGYWLNMVPYALNAGVDANYNGTYPAPAGTYETSLISTIQGAISYLLANFAKQELAFGQRCTTHDGGGNTCSVDPIFAGGGTYSKAVCLSSGGAWTGSPTVDNLYLSPTLASYLSTMTTNMTNYQTLVSNIITKINGELLIDTDPTRTAFNNTALASATTISNAINLWLSYINFSTYSGPSDHIAFYSAGIPGSSRLERNVLLSLQASLTNRNNDISVITNNRIGLLTSSNFLGSMTQTSGGAVSGSGLYRKRYDYIALRLNLAGGSLFALNGLYKGIASQNQLILNAQAERSTYASLLTCSALSAPSNSTNYVSVKDASGFAQYDNIYIVSDTMPEIPRTIAKVEGNRIRLAQPVPTGYLTNQTSRLYKDLT